MARTRVYNNRIPQTDVVVFYTRRNITQVQVFGNLYGDYDETFDEAVFQGSRVRQLRGVGIGRWCGVLASVRNPAKRVAGMTESSVTIRQS